MTTISSLVRRLPATASALVATATLCALAGPAEAREPFQRGGQVLVPESSVEYPEQIGKQVHTHLRKFQLSGGMAQISPPGFGSFGRTVRANASAPYSGYYYIETPASLACVYNLATPIAGCNPYSTSSVAKGGSKAIAIVIAYDNPNALSDLTYFSNQFGLPTPNLQVVYASGARPSYSSSWALESSTDIEMAHTTAPGAKLYLVEAASASLGDLMTAVKTAANLVAAAGGGEVSMSWGSSEFSNETSYDSYFTTANVVFVASSGDSAGPEYPAASPNVVSVGGTSLSRNPSTGNFQAELAWQQTGGGPSVYERTPAYQSGVTSVVSTARGTPDVSAVADPTTGVWVYQGGSWHIVGGTSVAAPLWAGIINAAGKFSASSAAELQTIYGTTTGRTAISSGDCGPYEGYLAAGSYSFCTGLGSPNGIAGK